MQAETKKKNRTREIENQCHGQTYTINSTMKSTGAFTVMA